MLEILTNQILSTESGRVFAHYTLGVLTGFYSDKSFSATGIDYYDSPHMFRSGSLLVAGLLAEIIEVFQHPENFLAVANQYDVIVTLLGAGSSAFREDIDNLTARLIIEVGILKETLLSRKGVPYVGPRLRVRKQRVLAQPATG